MRRTISTVPACLEALVALGRRALPEAEVCDGQPTMEQVEADDIVCVGFTGEPGEPAVNNDRAQQQGTPDPDRESYTVTCVASSWRGHETDIKEVRDATYAMVNAFAGELAADPTLGRTVGRTRIATDAYAGAQTDRGAVATVRFTIAVEAFTRR